MFHQLNEKTLTKDREYKKIESRVQEIYKRTKMMEAFIKVEISHLQKVIMELPIGTLSSFTKNNPRKRVQAITLRSGNQLDTSTLEFEFPYIHLVNILNNFHLSDDVKTYT